MWSWAWLVIKFCNVFCLNSLLLFLSRFDLKYAWLCSMNTWFLPLFPTCFAPVFLFAILVSVVGITHGLLDWTRLREGLVLIGLAIGLHEHNEPARLFDPCGCLWSDPNQLLHSHVSTLLAHSENHGETHHRQQTHPLHLLDSMYCPMCFL